MNNFCGVARYMIASSGVSFDETQTDPVEAKKSVSESLGRVVNVLDVVLHDLDELTPAPTPAADTAVEVISEPLTRARDKFVSAKSTVDAAPEMTTDVFSTVIQDMTEAVTVMNEAVEKMDVVSLPDEYRDAVGDAENCGS
jgi:phage I-like protein